MDRDAFYDTSRIAIVPIGPVLSRHGRTAPTCRRARECAPLWQPRFRAALPDIGLTLLVGSYAQAYYLGEDARRRRWRNGARLPRLPARVLLLPHPSWRNMGWLKKNPWFAKEVLPALRRRVDACMRPV